MYLQKLRRLWHIVALFFKNRGTDGKNGRNYNKYRKLRVPHSVWDTWDKNVGTAGHHELARAGTVGRGTGRIKMPAFHVFAKLVS